MWKWIEDALLICYIKNMFTTDQKYIKKIVLVNLVKGHLVALKNTANQSGLPDAADFGYFYLF